MSTSSIPDSSLKGLGSLLSARDTSLEIAGRRVWFIKVDFPEPDTPVTQTNKSSGNSKFIFLLHVSTFKKLIHC